MTCDEEEALAMSGGFYDERMLRDEKGLCNE
jgi:hypothetical protein